MDNLALYLALTGWIYLFILNNRVLKRAEIGRLKDTVIDKLISESEWLCEYTKTERNFVKIEQIWSTKITQIELKLKLLNKLAKRVLLDPSELAKLRELEFEDKPELEDIDLTLTELTSDLIEKLEIKYNCNFFDLNPLTKIPERHRYEAIGLIIGLSISILFCATRVYFLLNI